MEAPCRPEEAGDEEAARQQPPGGAEQQEEAEHGEEDGREHQGQGAPDGEPSGAGEAPRFHAGCQRDRPLDGVTQHRHRNGGEHAESLGRLAAQASCPAHPLRALDQLGSDAEGHNDGDRCLVQGCRYGPEGPARVGQCVGRPVAEQHDREPEGVVEGTDEPFGRHSAAEPDARRPVREQDLGEREEDGVP